MRLREHYQVFHDYEIVTVACALGALSYMILGHFESAWGVVLAHAAGMFMYVASGAYKAVLDARYPQLEWVADEKAPIRKAA